LLKKLGKRKLSIFLIALAFVGGAIYSFLKVDAVEVLIRTDSKKQELFSITTAINYSEIMKSTTRGRVTRLVRSDIQQRLPIEIDNTIFFSHIFANVYHPDYVYQQKQYANRSITWTVKYPEFKPKSWVNVMTHKTKIRTSRPPKDLGKSYAWSQAIQSGELIRIADVLGHLIRFRKEYSPLFATQGSKGQLRRYLPRLDKIIAYTKENIEVAYDELDDYDRDNLRRIDQERLAIEEYFIQ